MADTRIDSSRSSEPRTGKASAQAMASAKSNAAAGEQGQGFSSLLAALDSFAMNGLQPAVTTTSTTAQDEQTALPGLSEQDALLAAQGHAPWMSLVAQTAQLDGQGDVDMRQGAATDFLSGRGQATQLAHRQALQVGDAASSGAHAAFMGKELQSNLPRVQVDKAQAAMNMEATALPQVQEDAAQFAAQLQAESQSAQPDDGKNALSVRADAALHKPVVQSPQGISLQGMTAVQPQTLEGLKDLLRAARSPQQEEGAVNKAGGTQGPHDLLAAAAAVGAAMGAASAGMQGGGQNASDFGQNLAGQDAAPTEREQEVSEQVALWVHQKTQNASVSIQHEGKPIQVQVQLNGQEAHVRFAADDAQARQLLADGQAQLRELLQSQGLSLSGVSVDAGAADSGSGRQSADQQPAQARTARVTVAADMAGVAGTAASNATRNTQSGVDLFV